MTVQRAANATNRKSVPRKPIYFSGCGRPTSSICFSIEVTIISNRFCQRVRFSSVERLRVISLAPKASTSISPHVNTMVPLSLIHPCCQKIIWSGLRRMAGLLNRLLLIFPRRPRQPHHGEPRGDESGERADEPLPVSAADQVESGQDDARAQQAAAEKPARRMSGRNGLAHGPPQTAEENHAEGRARQPRQPPGQRFIHRRLPVRPAWPCPAAPPSTTHSRSRSRGRRPSGRGSTDGRRGGSYPA